MAFCRELSLAQISERGGMSRASAGVAGRTASEVSKNFVVTEAMVMRLLHTISSQKSIELLPCNPVLPLRQHGLQLGDILRIGEIGGQVFHAGDGQRFGFAQGI